MARHKCIMLQRLLCFLLITIFTINPGVMGQAPTTSSAATDTPVAETPAPSTTEAPAVTVAPTDAPVNPTTSTPEVTTAAPTDTPAPTTEAPAPETTAPATLSPSEAEGSTSTSATEDASNSAGSSSTLVTETPKSTNTTDTTPAPESTKEITSEPAPTTSAPAVDDSTAIVHPNTPSPTSAIVSASSSSDSDTTKSSAKSSVNKNTIALVTIAAVGSIAILAMLLVFCHRNTRSHRQSDDDDNLRDDNTSSLPQFITPSHAAPTPMMQRDSKEQKPSLSYPIGGVGGPHPITSPAMPPGTYRQSNRQSSQLVDPQRYSRLQTVKQLAAMQSSASMQSMNSEFRDSENNNSNNFNRHGSDAASSIFDRQSYGSYMSDAARSTTTSNVSSVRFGRTSSINTVGSLQADDIDASSFASNTSTLAAQYLRSNHSQVATSSFVSQGSLTSLANSGNSSGQQSQTIRTVSSGGKEWYKSIQSPEHERYTEMALESPELRQSFEL